MSSTPSDVPSPAPSPLPPHIARPVRKLSNAAHTAISAGQAAFHALASQVGGHPGVLASEDNTLIIKTSLPNERAFYEVVARGSGPLEGAGFGGEGGEGGEEGGVERLAKWTPRFYGVLRLEGRVKATENEEVGGGGAPGGAEVGLEQGKVEPIAEVEEKDKYLPPTSNLTFLYGFLSTSCNAQSIVLENVSSLFTKPNIMDIKLGTVLHEEEATPEKKERMMETARNTTSLETGVRLTGFQVYDYTANEQIITPKSYGKSIKASDLPDGIRRFFPLSSCPSPSDSSTPAPTTPSGQGLPRELLLPIIRGLLNDIKELRDVLAKTELRIVGGSLLIVYEADWEVARAALDAKTATLSSGGGTSEVTNSAGVEAAEEDDDEMGYDSDVESEEEEAPAYVVKLIDFAHTRFTPGQGPDEGVLKGMDTTIGLFEGRIKELEAGS